MIGALGGFGVVLLCMENRATSFYEADCSPWQQTTIHGGCSLRHCPHSGSPIHILTILTTFLSARSNYNLPGQGLAGYRLRSLSRFPTGAPSTTAHSPISKATRRSALMRQIPRNCTYIQKSLKAFRLLTAALLPLHPVSCRNRGLASKINPAEALPKASRLLIAP